MKITKIIYSISNWFSGISPALKNTIAHTALDSKLRLSAMVLSSLILQRERAQFAVYNTKSPLDSLRKISLLVCKNSVLDVQLTPQTMETDFSFLGTLHRLDEFSLHRICVILYHFNQAIKINQSSNGAVAYY